MLHVQHSLSYTFGYPKTLCAAQYFTYGNAVYFTLAKGENLVKGENLAAKSPRKSPCVCRAGR